MSRRPRRQLRRWIFPIAGWLSAAMYFVVAGGLPLPIPQTATKDRSVPFPCMDCACGCGNADQCWTGCCCHTPAERLAWAREHGVTPPRALVVMVDTRPQTAFAAEGASRVESKSCWAAKRSCCQSKPDCCHDSPVASPRQPTEDFSILGLRALVCHGFGTNWLTAVIAVPLNVPGCVQPLAAESVVTWRRLQFSSRGFPPPVPPPRPAAV